MTRVLTTLALLIALRAAPVAALSEVICTGDCNYDHTTAINELITGVNIALDRASIDTCRGFDLDGNGSASIDELVVGVGNALDGCPRARLIRSACEFTLPPDQPPAGVSCGSVIVQEDRSRSDGRTVRIPFAVFHARPPVGIPCGRGGCTVDDPFVYLSGGPGDPTLEFVQFSIPNVFAPFQAERDLVFFDQRGTGRLLPSLDCREWRDAFSAYLAVAQSVDVAGEDQRRQIADDRLILERRGRWRVPERAARARA